MLLEVIVQTIEDAREAWRGGADRLEVVRDIERDGLTPSLSLVKAIAADVELPLRVMVREAEGFELTGDDQLTRLGEVVRTFGALGVHGVVLGFVRAGRLDLEAMRQVLSAAPAIQATLHRAFDQLADPVGAIAEARLLPQVDRILTSGGAGPMAARVQALRHYADAAGERPLIVAGGGVDGAMLRALALDGAVQEVHVGRAARPHGHASGPVSADLVRRLRDVAG